MLLPGLRSRGVHGTRPLSARRLTQSNSISEPNSKLTRGVRAATLRRPEKEEMDGKEEKEEMGQFHEHSYLHMYF